jgi:hypothetical protein
MANPKRLGDYVEVGTFTLLSDARMVEALLRSEELDVHLQGQDIVGAMPHMADALGGVSVYVPGDAAERARELIASSGGQPESAADAAALEGDATDVSARDAAAKRAFLAAVLGIVFLPGVLHLVSIWQLVAYARTPGLASPRGRRRAVMAGIIDAAVVALAVALLVA